MDIDAQSKYTRQSEPSIDGFEAERLIQTLRCFDIKEIGTAKWIDQHQSLEKLNIAAHHNIQSQSDEFVAAALETFEKIPVLVHDLILTEVWKNKVYPLLEKHMSELSTIKAYMLLYHEATVLNLLQAVLFNRSLCKTSGDCLTDLAEYCYRHMVHLSSKPEDPELRRFDKDFAQKLMSRTELEMLQDQKQSIDFQVSMLSLTITRYLTDHIAHLHPGVLSQFLDHKDLIVVMIELLENPPWTARDKQGMRRFEDMKWENVSPSNLRKVGKAEAQVWLSLVNLICDDECRNKYKWDENRKTTVLKLRRFFTEVLVDQLPVLADLQRAVETLAIMNPPEPSTKSKLLLEALPEIADTIMRGADWKEIAKYQRENVLKNTPESRREDAMKFASIYNLDMLDDVLEDPKCAACGKIATKRCSRCKNEWYCGRECQVGAWKIHKPMCDLVSNDAQALTNAAANV